MLTDALHHKFVILMLTLLAVAMTTEAALTTPSSATDAAGDTQFAFEIRIAGDATRTRIVLEFEDKPEFSYHYLDAPHRVVVDFPETVFGFSGKEAEPRGLLTDVRYGAMAPGRSRMVVSASGPVQVAESLVLEDDEADSYRLVLDMESISHDEFAALLSKQQWYSEEQGESKEPAPGAAADPAHKFTVVIDPGHGGIDSGTRGRNGLEEKEVTLNLGTALKDLLADNSAVEVFMTRTDDRFVSLGDRVRYAREQGADLFVSLHADSIRLRKIRGATVYTLSEKASDDYARDLAQRENKSDAIAGLSFEDEPERVADILIDLMRRETKLFSVRFADSVIENLDGKVELINNPHRYAGFRVLRAPDVPSILVEIGYLSNAEDEKLLQDENWLAEMADLLAKAVDDFRVLVRGDGEGPEEVNLSRD
ncbi:N-acetylmuramoyl-L-alanine amidase [Hoeflea sp. WL0058]|uniref:N-acetylmuramoyl-L-alanine amidase n=1 Tax=Flavimaribacter sediminis TaxID=2865987 RepID=A0AAE2ZT23_9HYPH|nr:N-acetylmuramoyl-L-alanine amidase [Flavimaribacter sediminis]